MIAVYNPPKRVPEWVRAKGFSTWRDYMAYLRERKSKVRNLGRRREREFFGGNPSDKRPPKRWWKRCTKDVRASAKRYGRRTDPAKVCGSEWYDKMSESERRRIQENPRAQLVYGRLVELRAQKTEHPEYAGEYFKHRFHKSSHVVVEGLPDGSLRIRSLKGVRLWKPE